MTWQLRAQVKNLLQRKPTTAIRRPGPVAPRFEPTSSFVGRYGSPASPKKVSALKHAQDLSGWTPARSEYWWLVPAHFVVSTLWIVAISSIVWHIWDWLTTPLIVFR